MATINLDLSNPSNAIRALVGDVDVCDPIMSDSMYQQIYDLNDINDRNECVIAWFASIQAAEIIMAQYAPTGQRYRERVNAVEVENYGSERYKNYQNLVKYLRNNPPMNCPLSNTLFYFGGTYTQCDNIYTLKYINKCLCGFWGLPNAWIDGYQLSWQYGEGTIYIP